MPISWFLVKKLPRPMPHFDFTLFYLKSLFFHFERTCEVLRALEIPEILLKSFINLRPGLVDGFQS